MVMKKKTARIIGAFGVAAAVTLILLASYEEKKNAVVNNCKGVTMTITEGSISSEGLTLDIKNDTDKEITVEEDYIIEKSTRGQWYKLPSQSLTHDWEEEPLVIPPKTEVKEACSVSWLESYGELPAGRYRLLKKCETEDEKEYILAVTFSL